MKNKIEAIIICVNYSDFLKITLFKNSKYFDNIIVVSSETDEDTAQICSLYSNVCLIKTDAFYFNNAAFNKGLAIDVGFKYLQYRDWIINLDADIVLPENFRSNFLTEATDINCAYSARRFDVPKFKEWEKIENQPSLLNNKLLYRGIGYGNFFCFNYNSNIFQSLLKITDCPYPYWFPHVAESDWIFRNFWSDWIYDPPLNDDPNQHNIENKDRAANPTLLKELTFKVIHLGETGKNESKRLTPHFQSNE